MQKINLLALYEHRYRDSCALKYCTTLARFVLIIGDNTTNSLLLGKNLVTTHLEQIEEQGKDIGEYHGK